jgi:hypothetical protein
VTPEPRSEPNARDGHEAPNPRRVGSLARDKPISLVSRPWRAAMPVVRARWSQAQEGRGGEGRAVPARGRTLEGRSPGELRAVAGLNRRRQVADSRVERNPEGGDAIGARPFCSATGPSASADGAVRGGRVDVELPDVKRVRGRRRRCTAAREEQRSEGRNPMSGSGMRQGQQARGG